MIINTTGAHLPHDFKKYTANTPHVHFVGVVAIG